AFIMGAAHGINAAALFGICCHVIRPLPPLERWTLRAAAGLMGASGAGFVSLVGTTTNDLTSSLFVMGALLGVLRVAGSGNEGGARLGFSAAGLLSGIGIGLKYTSAIYIPGLGAIALLVAARRRAIGGLVAFGGVGGGGVVGISRGRRVSFAPLLVRVWESDVSLPQSDLSIAVLGARSGPRRTIPAAKLLATGDLPLLLGNDRYLYRGGTAFPGLARRHCLCRRGGGPRGVCDKLSAQRLSSATCGKADTGSRPLFHIRHPVLLLRGAGLRILQVRRTAGNVDGHRHDRVIDLAF